MNSNKDNKDQYYDETTAQNLEQIVTTCNHNILQIRMAEESDDDQNNSAKQWEDLLEQANTMLLEMKAKKPCPSCAIF
jgi:hypothetical protein